MSCQTGSQVEVIHYPDSKTVYYYVYLISMLYTMVNTMSLYVLKLNKTLKPAHLMAYQYQIKHLTSGA